MTEEFLQQKRDYRGIHSGVTTEYLCLPVGGRVILLILYLSLIQRMQNQVKLPTWNWYICYLCLIDPS